MILGRISTELKGFTQLNCFFAQAPSAWPKQQERRYFLVFSEFQASICLVSVPDLWWSRSRLRQSFLILVEAGHVSTQRGINRETVNTVIYYLLCILDGKQYYWYYCHKACLPKILTDLQAHARCRTVTSFFVEDKTKKEKWSYLRQYNLRQKNDTMGMYWLFYTVHKPIFGCSVDYRYLHHLDAEMSRSWLKHHTGCCELIERLSLTLRGLASNGKRQRWPLNLCSFLLILH